MPLQQLATNAAATIYGRVLTACECTEQLTPAAVLAAPVAALRAAGLSERKASYMADLARHFSDGSLSDEAIEQMEEAALEKALTAVRGIGLCAYLFGGEEGRHVVARLAGAGRGRNHLADASGRLHALLRDVPRLPAACRDGPHARNVPPGLT